MTLSLFWIHHRISRFVGFCTRFDLKKADLDSLIGPTGSRFGEQVCRIAALWQQLWRTALRGAAPGNSFGEQLSGAALDSFPD